jgi:hypothetical protein
MIPEGQRIVILEPLRDSNWVRFSAGREDREEVFTALPLMMELRCALVKPAAPKPE